MPGEILSNRAAVSERRDAVIDELANYYARDDLDLEAYEDRVHRVHDAETIEAIDALVADLRPGGTSAGEALANGRPDGVSHPGGRHGEDTALAVAAGPLSPAVAAPGRRKRLVAVLSGVERRGKWRVPRTLRIVTVLGGADLDFREAELCPGETHVKITSVLGGCEIIVPPGLAVECDGLAILGGIDHRETEEAPADPSQPMLRIDATAVLGGVSVITRKPGESQWAAWRNSRRRKRALARAERKQLRSGSR